MLELIVKECRFKKGGRYIWVTKGASNLEELNDKTKRTILRRKKMMY